MMVLGAVAACQLNVCAAMFGEGVYCKMALCKEPQAGVTLRLEMMLYNLQHIKATHGEHGVK